MSNKDIQSNILDLAGDLLYLIALLKQKKRQIKTFGAVSLFNKIDNFTNDISKILPQNQTAQAKYLICAALDEAHSLNNTDWHKDLSLVVYYYKEEFSGENFFKILNQLMKDTIHNKSLLELAYVILNLGFEGKYALSKDGKIELKNLKEHIYFIIYKNINPNLFINEIDSPKNKKKFSTIVMGILAFYISVLMSLYIYFFYIINTLNNKVNLLINKLFI